MNERFARSEGLIGEDGIRRLKESAVIVFGAGGVGSYVIEVLARTGIGKLAIVDYDTVDITNINRQIFALTSTVGRLKAEVARDRVLDINPECNVICHCSFVTPENIDQLGIEQYNWAADAVDNVTAKLSLAEYCHKNNIDLISSMGTGNKTDPTAFHVCDIYETSVCPLARVMRHELRKRNVPSLKVVFSTEPPISEVRPPASISFVPATAGLLIASHIINAIINK